MKINVTLSFCFTVLSLSLYGQWVRQYPLELLEPVQDIVVHNDGLGYAVGSNDLILKLDPGRNQWDLLTTWDLNWRFAAVDYLPGIGGDFVVAGGPGVIMSTDGGFNWTQIAGAPTGVHAIKIFSTTDIIVSASNGVHRWKDNTWQSLNLPVTSNVHGAEILDDQHIWAYTSGATPTIYYTTDGGLHWNSNTNVPRPDVVRFYNTLYGIAADGRMIYKTTNGGANWTLMSDNVISNTSADLAFGSSPNVIIAAQINAIPAITADSGKTWTNMPTGFINARSFAVAAQSDEAFYIGNDISSIAYTNDGGTSYVETSGPPRTIIQDAHFINRTDGWAVGLKGNVLKTVDGGTTWTDISTPNVKNFLSIHGLSANDLWIGSNQQILHSVNGGESWTVKATFISGNINDIFAISTSRVLAVSSTGALLRTKDGGMKWDTVYNSANQLRSIAQINAQQYMVTGFNGLLLRSEDQGDTWHTVAVPEGGLQYEQSYFIGNEGWLVTSSFKKTMWHTTNAGNSWDTLTLPIDRFWDGVYFITPDTGVVLCHSTSEARAYITYNGGNTWETGYIIPFALSGVTGVPNPNGAAWIFGFGSDIEVLTFCNTFPVISQLAGDVMPCENATIQYTVSGQDVDQYHWFFPAGWTAVGNPDNDTLTVIAGENSGFVAVVGTNICGFSPQLSVDVSSAPLPSIEFVEGDLAICNNQIATYFATGQNIDAFHWSFPPGWIVIGSQEQSEIHFQANNAGGIVSVYGSNECGNSEAQEIVVNNIPFPNFSFGVQGDSLLLGGAPLFVSFQWYLNGQPIPGATDSVYVVTTSGDYKVEVTDANGCMGFSSTQTIIFSGLKPVFRNDISIVPSPAGEFIYLDGIDEGASVKILDQLGRIILDDQYDGKGLSVSRLASGVYIMVSGERVGRFVKE